MDKIYYMIETPIYNMNWSDKTPIAIEEMVVRFNKDEITEEQLETLGSFLAEITDPNCLPDRYKLVYGSPRLGRKLDGKEVCLCCGHKLEDRNFV